MCYEGEPPRVIAHATIRARRGHFCDECGGVIHPRETYERVAGNWDGYWQRFKTCAGCLSLREAVIEHEEAAGCYGAEAVPPFGELWSCAREIGVVGTGDESE